jgi:Zn-dependent protease with chaperone function
MMSLEEGLKALQQQNYAEAVKLLESYCQQSTDFGSPLYIQGKMALARAYRGNNQLQNAMDLGIELEEHLDREVSSWASAFLSILSAEEKTVGLNTIGLTAKRVEKAGRSLQTGVKLRFRTMHRKLAKALVLTLIAWFSLLLGIFTLPWVVYPKALIWGLQLAVVIAVALTFLIYLVSVPLLDWLQTKLYSVRWVTLAELNRLSPESARVFQRLCREKSLTPPKIGIIDDLNPTAFTYGFGWGEARLIVSQGLFTHLDDEEAATVYAHELGHMTSKDLTVITGAMALVQLFYFGGVNLQDRYAESNGFVKGLSQIGVSICFALQRLFTVLMLHLARTREYFADHFAAEATGNPNALARALVKIPAGMVEAQLQPNLGSHLLAATRPIGIYDYQAALIPASAYNISRDGRKLSLVFLWDIFNPWARWLELTSTHPLMGKRLGFLANYAQELDLDVQFDFLTVVKEGYKLNKKQLHGTFILDWCIFYGQILGAITGIVVGLLLWDKKGSFFLDAALLGLTGFGLGTLIKNLFAYPSINEAHPADIFSLLCDPYANPLRARAVKLLLRIEELGAEIGKNMLFKDKTGLILARCLSFANLERFGNKPLKVIGWYRRGIQPWLTWQNLAHEEESLTQQTAQKPLLLGVVITLLSMLGWHFLAR